MRDLFRNMFDKNNHQANNVTLECSSYLQIYIIFYDQIFHNLLANQFNPQLLGFLNKAYVCSFYKSNFCFA